MTSNGKDKRNGKSKDDKNIVSFPSLAERDRIKRAEREQEKQWRAEYKKQSRANRGAARKIGNAADKYLGGGNSGSNDVPFFNFGNIPPFSRYLALSFVIIHLPLFLLLSDGLRLQTFYTFGFVPATFSGLLNGGFDTASIAAWLSLLSPFTHAFIHGGWTHLIFNAIMALVLGIFFERMFGAKRTAKFFTFCVLGGTLLYFVLNPFSNAPLIGASGGISGLFGALIYIMLTQMPHHPVSQMTGKYGPWPALAFWGLFMALPALFMGDGIAWQAHLGGYLTGVGILHLMSKKKFLL